MKYNCTSQLYKSMPQSKMTMYFNLEDDVLSLGVGDSGFSTPMSAAQGGIDSILAGRTFYTPSWGYPELRKETEKYLEETYGYRYNSSDILITSSATSGLDAILRAYVNPGDEIIMVAPIYSFYESIAALTGAKLIYAKTCKEDNWVLKASELKSLISDKTKMLILNYPNNPTGATMDKKQFESVAKVLSGTDILVVSDEIYAEYVYSEKHHSILECDGMAERTFLLSGYSKSLAMTGWRIGYIAAPKALIEPVAAITSVMTLCASAPAQEAALSGLKNSRKDVDFMREEYRQRRDFILSKLNEFGWTYTVPQGGFYIWADISKTGLKAEVLCQRLIEEAKLAIILGDAYGEGFDNYVRITFTKDMSELSEGMRRIENFLKANDMM